MNNNRRRSFRARPQRNNFRRRNGSMNSNNGANFNRKDPELLSSIGYQYQANIDKWSLQEMAADYIYLKDKDLEYDLPGSIRKVFDYSFWINNKSIGYPLINAEQYLSSDDFHNNLNFLSIGIDNINNSLLDKLKCDDSVVVVLNTNNAHGLAEHRRAILELYEADVKNPVIFRKTYTLSDAEDLQILASSDIGGLFLDGMGDGLFIECDKIDASIINSLSFGILQATRTRISKTEYIACPSCGRTLFDLQDVTAMIRSRTDHLIGIKIGIMGCIVNGPGEMADADYGYVGSGPEKITLYRGQEVVKRGLHETIAVDELINIIKEDGNWVERAK